MTGKQFEQLCLDRVRRDRNNGGAATISRCGVRAARMKSEWQILQSFPDFEGVLRPSGRQFTFDCKVCSKSSFALDEFRPGAKRYKAAQFNYLMERAEFGAIAFLLIHFSERQLKTRSFDAATYAVPVHPRLQMWIDFQSLEISSLARDTCAEFGERVAWNLPTARSNKKSPDILAAIEAMARLQSVAQSRVARE